MSGQGRAEFRVRASHVGDDALRNLNVRQRPLDEQAVGTVLDRFVDESGTVDACSGNRGKERLRRALLAAIDGVRHADVRTADEAGRRQQRAETHGDAQRGPLGHAEDLPVEVDCVHATIDRFQVETGASSRRHEAVFGRALGNVM